MNCPSFEVGEQTSTASHLPPQNGITPSMSIIHTQSVGRANQGLTLTMKSVWMSSLSVFTIQETIKHKEGHSAKFELARETVDAYA